MSGSMKKIYLSLFIVFVPGIILAQLNIAALIGLSIRSAIKEKAELIKARRMADSLGFPVRIENGSSIIELAGLFNGIPRYRATDNVNAAATTATSPLWSGGSAGLSLSGNGIVLGIWDGGAVRTTHREYTGRVIVTDGAVSISGHATHVAGTMIASGVDPLAKGMSPAASLQSNNWDDDIAEMAVKANEGLQVSNHSYGYLTGWYYNYRSDSKWVWFGDTTLSRTTDYGFGGYEWTSEHWDSVAFIAPDYLIVKSAGNDRGEGPGTQPVNHWVWNGGDWILSNTPRDRDGGTNGYDCIPWQGIAKNILTVAAVGDIPAGYHQPSDVVHAGFSGCGPADDGRIKPDISANGSNLYSAYSTNDLSYTGMSGTSMSTPNASGSVGLLLEHRKNLTGSSAIRSASIKGLIIHTANEAGPAVGPDYKFGWGLLNTKKAALLMSEDASNGLNFNLQELTLTQGETITIPVYTNGNEPLLATLCWTDPPSSVYGLIVNDRTPMLVNDLDLRLVNSAGLEYQPWKLDPENPTIAATHADNIVDNTEKVETIIPAAGETWFVKITHKGTLKDSAPQNFSLILSGIEPAPLASDWVGAESSEWTNSANWSNGIPSTVTDVIISGEAANKPSLSATAFCNNLTLSEGASILGNNLLTIYGTAVVERLITSDKYHYISSPINAATAGSTFPLTSFLRYYDEAHPSAQWVNIYQNDLMQTGKGYALFIPAGTGDATATFSGILNDGAVTANSLSFTENSTPPYDGYNLTGNPYPSAIDLESSGIVRTNLDAAVYFWNPALNGDLGGYAYWTIGGTGVNGATQYVPVAQGFFVKVSGVGLSGSISFNNMARTHNSQVFYKNELSNTLRITAKGGLFSDETVIRFAAGTTPLFDNQSDAWKLLNDQANQLYTRAADNGKLAINCIPGPEQTPVVPLNYRVVAPGTYTLTASGTESFDAGTPVVLLDLLANYRQDLRLMPEYQFTATPGDDENRFAIAFGTLATETAEFESVSIFSDGKSLTLTNPDQSSGLLQINDLSGKVIFETNIIGQSRITFPLALSAGIYIARYTGNGMNVGKKIIVANQD